MKRYFGIIVAVIGVCAGIVWAMRKWDTKNAESARDLNAARIRAEYLERAAWLRNVPDQKAYIDENQTFMTWYFKELTEHFNKHGGNREFDDYMKELDARTAKKGDDDGKIDEKKAVYAYTRKVFDSFKKKDYAPWWTATDKGVRLDIVSAETISMGPDRKIHLPVVVWGLPRDERTDDKGIKRVTVNASFKFNWKLYDEKQKLIAEIPGEGGPDSRVDWPDRFVKFFPPMVVLGHYDIDVLPAETKTADIEWTITARAPTGGDMNLTYSWKGEVPAAWKLGTGEAWKGATDSVRPEEEINAQAPQKKK
ncbi:MAG TPA: hypothetical protein VGD87_11820 [Archangium sp.]